MDLAPGGPAEGARMSGFNAAFKAEVARLARKEIREQVGATKKASAVHRREIAQLKREIAALHKQLARLQKSTAGGTGARATAAPAAAADTPRFSPKWLKAHRNKLGLSAREYALLVGVSTLTIYNWESGKSKPQAAKLEALAAVRGMGKREAHKRLDELEG